VGARRRGEPERAPARRATPRGFHILEVEVPLDQLAKILGEELELPDIKHKGRKQSRLEKDKYSGVATAGPESLRHVKAHVQRRRSSGRSPRAPTTHEPPDHTDSPRSRYRTWPSSASPRRNAVIVT